MDTQLEALVVDEEPELRKLLEQVLTEDGWIVTEAQTADQAFEMLGERKWSVVFCDISWGADGFGVLRRFREASPETRVVLMSSHGSAAEALDATAFGAYDYLLKPVGAEELHLISAAIFEQLTALREHPLTDRRKSDRRKGSIYQPNLNLVGRSEAFIEVMKTVGRVAGTDLPVMLTGESGTGKGLIASALHRRSARANKQFVTLNCAAIPAELIESELFGHIQGSFTGADRDRRGLWEEADGGTIFLDEVVETSAAFQTKLLRVLQDNEIRRVGSNVTQKVDVRVIAASNRDVDEEVKSGRFRHDLFYRLNGVAIDLPPLRERSEDIVPLARSFAEGVFSLNPMVRFAADVLPALERYPWPGNIRELENAVVRAAAMCDGLIRLQDLPERIRSYEIKRPESDDCGVRLIEQERWPPLSEVEGQYVTQVLRRTEVNKQAAARLLGVDRKTLDRMIKRHHIDIKNLKDSTSRAA